MEVKYLIRKIKTLAQLFVNFRFVIILSEKSFGHSYSWNNKHLFKSHN